MNNHLIQIYISMLSECPVKFKSGSYKIILALKKPCFPSPLQNHALTIVLMTILVGA